MANYNELITAMEAVIKENGNEEITGVILQNTLRAMIQVLGVECQFAGVATPQTVPGTPDYRVAYILGAGIYPNFNGASVQNGNIAIASNTGIGGAWDVEQIALIPNGTIVTAMIANNAITEDKIANNAVTENKINNGAVTENKINNGAVTENKIGNGAVTENKIANNAVTENKIADDAVTTNKIKNKNVTREKLSDKLNDELDNKANIDGFYSTLGAGVAENLVGRGSVPAEYTFRTSGGSTDLGSGTAQIKRLMGRTLVFNQLVQNGNFANADGWYESDVSSFAVSNNEATVVLDNGMGKLIRYMSFTAGHKYYISICAKASENITNLIEIYDGVVERNSEFNLTTSYQKTSTILTASNTIQGEGQLQVIRATGTNQSITVKNAYCIDLTIMFGAGNEPSTVEEFESLFPLDYYAYNPGTLLSVNATGIKTVGFNQWDEEWELGAINPETGQSEDSSYWGRTKNFIRVIPDTTYYAKLPQEMYLLFYDINGNYIGNVYKTVSGTFDTPANAYYIKLSNYGWTSYNHDLCINLSWSGYRNGEYEPYWESELPIPITTMTGKLNGAGASIAMFADGFKSAGTAFDEITANGAVKRIGKIDLGTLSWNFYPSTGGGAREGRMYAGGITNIKFANVNSLANILCPKYITDTADNTYNHRKDKSISLDGGTVLVYDSDYTSSDQIPAFQAAMSGVYLYYEFDTPEEYILDAEQPMNYRVDDFGTEMELPQNDDEPVTAPIRYDVQYAMNAVDTLRRLPENYISKESFADFLAEFDSKVGAAINATIVSTMTFNAETQKYGFNITITPNNP